MKSEINSLQHSIFCQEGSGADGLGSEFRSSEVLKKECVPSHNHKKCPEPCTVDAIVAGCGWGGWGGTNGWNLIWENGGEAGSTEASDVVDLFRSAKMCSWYKSLQLAPFLTFDSM